MLSKVSLRYLLSLTPGILVVAGNLMGGWWALSNTAYTLVLLIGLECLMQENKAVNDVKDGTAPNIILSLHVLLHTAGILSLLYGIHSGILSGVFVLWGSLSTGICSGVEGINSAHELIHRKQWYARWSGIWNLLLVNYGHFYIEHIRNHHRNVGTLKDPATARLGESVYRFFIRTVPQQYASALKIEAERLKKINKSPYGINNLILQFSLFQLALCICIYFFFGSIALLAYLNQSWIAFFLLEYVNYIEHYGLVREEGTKVNAAHSWQSDMPVSRFTLIELSRHSDHHITASKPYYELIRYEDSPVLPSGYFGAFYLAMIPPLWFRKINPLVEKHLNPVL